MYTLDENLTMIADRILDAASRGDDIQLVTDPDSDGTMSMAILYAGLSDMGISCKLTVLPAEHGYGIRPEDCARFNLNHKDNGYTHHDVCVCLDTGSTSLGVLRELPPEQVCILDHHTVGERYRHTNTDARSILEANPTQHKEIDRQDAGQDADSGICTATLASKLLEKIEDEICVRNPYSKKDYSKEHEWFKICEGVAIASEKEAMTKENEKTMKQSADIAKKMQNGCFVDASQTGPYTKRLMECMQSLIQDRITSSKKLDAVHITEQLAYHIAPVFNAGKSMDLDPKLGMRILFCKDATKQKELLQSVDDAKKEKQEIIDSCMKYVNDHDQFVYRLSELSPELKDHQGVNRPLVERMAATLNHPVVIETAKHTASFASPKNYPLTRETSDGTRSLLTDMGAENVPGHERAFTMNLKEGRSLERCENAMKAWDESVPHKPTTLAFASEHCTKKGSAVSTNEEKEKIEDQIKEVLANKGEESANATLTFSFQDVNGEPHMTNNSVFLKIGNLNVCAFNQTNAIMQAKARDLYQQHTVQGIVKMYNKKAEFIIDNNAFPELIKTDSIISPGGGSDGINF